MQVTNNAYRSYNQTTSVTETQKSSENSFTSMLTNSENVEEKEEIGKHLKFMDQYNVFDSLSEKDRKIFREILKDDNVTMAEIDSLSYEQAEIFMDYARPPATLPKEEFVKGPIVYMTNQINDMLFATRMTNDKTFNEALYRASREISNDNDRSNITSEVKMNVAQAHFGYEILPSFYVEARTKNQWDWDYDDMNIDFDKFLNDVISMHKNAIENPPIRDSIIIKQHQEVLDGYNIILKHYIDVKSESSRYA